MEKGQISALSEEEFGLSHPLQSKWERVLTVPRGVPEGSGSLSEGTGTGETPFLVELKERQVP